MIARIAGQCWSRKPGRRHGRWGGDRFGAIFLLACRDEGNRLDAFSRRPAGLIASEAQNGGIRGVVEARQESWL
jgi:hypothetical protein